MRNIYLILLFFIVLLSFVQSTEAQEIKEAPHIWDLQTCLDYAKAHNIQVRSLVLTQRINQQAFLLSKASLYPNLNGNASQTYVHSNNPNVVVSGLQSQANFSGSYAVQSNVTLFNGGYLRNTINQQKLELDAAAYNISVAENDITLQVAQSYLSIVLAQENSVYLEAILSTSKAQVSLGEKQFNAGSIAKKDLVQLQAQQATDNYNLVNAQNTIRQNLLNLKQLLQLPSGFDLQIKKPEHLEVEAPLTSLEAAQSEALANRPEIKSSALATEVAEVNLKIAKAGFIPSITANASVGSGYSDNSNVDYSGQLSNNFNQRIGLTLAIPIFSNRSNKTNTEIAKIDIEQAEINQSNTKMILEQQVEQAYINFVNYHAQYMAAQEQKTATDESYRISLEQLRLGGISTVDFLLQKNLYIQAVQNFIEAKYNAVISLKIYDFYHGEPVKL